MKMKLTLQFLIAGFVLASIPAQSESLVNGSAEAGKNKSLTCTACHGQEGNSVSPMWPSIAGQGAPYITAQLSAFKTGLRADPLMTAQSMLLTDDDIRDLAVYFEGLPRATMAVADPTKVTKGLTLFRGGDAEAGVPACMSCHGPTGRGNPAAGYPAVAGQHAMYAAKQLRDYASGSRTSDGKTRIMRDIAVRLSAEEIDAVASYMQGLQ